MSIDSFRHVKTHLIGSKLFPVSLLIGLLDDVNSKGQAADEIVKRWLSSCLGNRSLEKIFKSTMNIITLIRSKCTIIVFLDLDCSNLRLRKLSISYFYDLNLSVSGALKTKKNWEIFFSSKFSYSEQSLLVCFDFLMFRPEEEMSVQNLSMNVTSSKLYFSSWGSLSFLKFWVVLKLKLCQHQKKLCCSSKFS